MGTDRRDESSQHGAVVMSVVKINRRVAHLVSCASSAHQIESTPRLNVRVPAAVVQTTLVDLNRKSVAAIRIVSKKDLCLVLESFADRLLS